MSTVYFNEPPTSGKVLLKTTMGDIEIDLWSKEAPRACKNFIGLCLNRYYHGTIFHRVVKGFVVQGGDPTGTGTGGESLDGVPLADEFHQRLKFIRRGLVAMANSGPNDNKSQFFITLSAANDLNNKHTIFGSVVNNTIYNVLKMEELEIGDEDRPIVPPKILKTIVIENPFKEITSKKDSGKEAESNAQAFNHIKAVKNKNLLSFGDDEEGDEEIVIASNKKSKSSHDILDDPNLSKQPVVDPSSIVRQPKTKEPEIIETNTEHNEKEVKEPEIILTEIEKLKAQQDKLREQAKSTKRKMKQMKEESQKVQKNELLDENELLAGFGPLRKDFTVNESIGEYILSNNKYAKRKKILPILNKTNERELLTLSMLKNFENELSTIQKRALIKKGEREEIEVNLDTETDWMAHMLVFEKSNPYVSGAIDANVENIDRYDISDPRHPMNIRKSGGVKKET